jgi:hypothetical protein
MPAASLPEGVSPDNQDCAFVPGGVSNRAALQKVFSVALPSTGGVAPTVIWGKSYVSTSGVVENLYLASDGNLYWEDPVHAPGVYNNFGTVTPGSWAKSVTAFGREFIAISDGLHGTDIPLQWDGTNLDRVTQDGPGASPSISTVPIGSSTLAAAGLTRSGNVVTATTTGAHGLLVGYQAQVSSVAAQAIGGGVSAISINNENAPGIATVTTFSAHGLLPGLFISLTGVYGTAVGGGINFIQRVGQVVTVGMNSAHGLSPGAVVSLAGVGVSSFNTTAQVQTIISLTAFTFVQVDVNASSSGGTVSINWPIPNTATPSYFEVLSAPTSTTFQIAINYSDGNWNTGIINYAWNGIFQVSSVPSPTTFTYQQYGPPVTCIGSGTVTPFGQISPGAHQMQVLFLTRQGTITEGSPPVKFFASGGDYPSITNIPIGPSNIVARILAFTGAGGSMFYYIPAVPQVNGQVMGTATQINDNTTTSVTLDFSDPTLFAALGISIPGNNIANQIVLDGALGFGLYAGRLITWGQRNRIQNFLNMGFDGGALPSASTLPSGWTAAGGALAAGRFGQAWQVSGAGSLAQPAFQDCYGAPILTAATKYQFRAWVKGAATTVTATLSGTGFSITATINGTAAGVWAQANFNSATPSPIPPDAVLTITWTGTPLIDELSIIYQQNPYLETVLYGSYIDNPEAFDGVTGKFGSAQDLRKVMDISEIRRTGYLLTQDPGGRLHEFSDNGVTEPAGWSVDQVAANCGLLSAFGLTKSQADDSSSAGGEEWFAWCSSVGARLFGGGDPYEISREIRPDWANIVPDSQKLCWALNVPAERTIYFGLAQGGPRQGAPNRVYSMNYVGLDSASAIGTTGPVRIGYAGKRIATDHARKWTRWNATTYLNSAALMYRDSGTIQPVFMGGNGTFINVGGISGYGQAYTLNPAKYTDDDYGQLVPYYTICFLPGEETEAAKELAGFRKLLSYVMAYISSPVPCTLKVTPYVDQLTTPWPLTVLRSLVVNPAYDVEFAGCSAQGNRISLKFAALPSSGTDCGFNLQRLAVWLRKATLPIRGAV